ncbi:MAG: hypothetical protein Q8O14_02325 [bacterium]|jgi:hypothetical protein|nr:hypothetical protein [bacterium]
MTSNSTWKPRLSADRSPEREDEDLRALFHSLRPRSGELPDLAEERRRLEARLARGRAAASGARAPGLARLEKGWMEMWRPANWSLLRVAGACALLAVVLACTVPLDYDREAGLNLRLTINGELQPVLELLREGPWSLDALRVDEGATASVVEARLRDARVEDLEILRTLAVVEELESGPWAEERRGTLFTMMMDNVFHLRLDISGMSDEQINEALGERLQAEGYPGRVTVRRQEGMPQVLVEVEGDEGATPGQLTIELSDRRDSIATEGVWVQEGRPLNLELGQLEGLSEEEIRARVRQQLQAAGLHPDSSQIFIQRHESGEGQRRQAELKVEVRAGE